MRHVPIDAYFKSKSNLNPSGIKIMSENQNVAKKRRNLSLVKTPTILKSPKYTDQADVSEVKKEADVICLSSDDENGQLPPVDSHSLILSSTDPDTNSQTTIIYTLTPQTSANTPRKTPTPQSASSDSFQSPSKKFFSPTKKRNVVKRSSVKRSLAREFFIQPKLYSDDTFYKNACEGMDDKSIFLLTIINKFLKDNSLTHLLMEISQKMLGQCFQVAKPGMRIVCRLYWRQPGWYRREQLIQISSDKKNTIDDQTFQEMLESLILNSFITISSGSGINSLTFEEYAKILKADEIKQICKDLKLKIQTKQKAIEALSAFRRRPSICQFFTGASTNNATRVLDMMKTKAGICYKLSDIARNTFHKLYILMYLGMNYSTIRDKQLELMLINDKIKRETYPIDKSMELDSASVVFRSRDEFDMYLQAHMLYENYIAETDASEKCKTVIKVYKLYKEISEDNMMRYKTLPEWLRRFTPPYLYIKILESGIQELKKDKSGVHFGLALDILTRMVNQLAFRRHKIAEWYAEKALILHKLLFRHDEAAKILIEGLESDLPEDSKDVMRPRANQLAKQKNIELDSILRTTLLERANNLVLENQFPSDHVSKQPMENYKQRGKKKFEIHTEDEKKFLDCEQYCIIHYTTNGPFTHGEHWEGRIITTIFYLLFWDIIYTKPVGVSGIFLSHYQLHPLDMFTESFYTNRKALIDERLKKIESMAVNTLVETMRIKWEERPEYELSGITRSIGWDNLRMVAGCLGAAATGAICRRLVRNTRAHSGFPDLTLWNAATKKIKFVEVKTDTDKPSMKQLQWMQYLAENGIDTGFCYVGAHTTRCKARSEPAVPRSMRDSILFESSPP